MLTIPEDFQRKLDDFNRSQGEPEIAVMWDNRRKRWTIWALPKGDTSHPHYKGSHLAKLTQPMGDGSGRQGVFLFRWCEYGPNGEDRGYLPLDDRVFQALRLADSFRSHRHFEEHFDEPEARKAMEENKRVRDIAYAARSYFWGLDKLISGPGTRGDWRWRIR